jgi:hypothetical protein
LLLLQLIRFIIRLSLWPDAANGNDCQKTRTHFGCE